MINMNSSNTSSSYSYKATQTFKEMCILIKSSSLRLNKKMYFFLQAVVVIHVLSIIIPPISVSSPPWDYPHLSFLWDVIGTIARPNYLREYINMPAWMAFFPFIGYLAFTCLHCFIFLSIYTNITTAFEILEMFDSRMKKGLLVAEAYLRIIYSEVGFIPTIFLFAELPKILSSYGFDTVITWLMFVLFAIPTVYFWLIESLYLQNISMLSDSYNILSRPVYIVHKRIAYILLIMIERLVLYQIHPIFRSLFQGVIGIHLMYKFAWCQPYSKIQCNIMEAIKAAMLVSSSIIYLLLISADSVTSSDPSATLMFFLSIPFQIYILIHFMKSREKHIIKATDKIDDILYLYKILIYQLNKESRGKTLAHDREKNFIESYLMNFGNNGWGIVWIIYYFMIKQNYINVHILLSTSRTIRNNWECSIYIEEAKRSLLRILKNADNIEWEGYHYIKYKEMLNQLMTEDKLCCDLAMTTYREIVHPEINANVFSNHIVKFISQLKKTKDLYSYLIKNFEKNSELLELYSGFLEILMNSPFFKDILLKGARMKEEEMKQFVNKEEEVNFFYRDNMKLAVSLEPKNTGEIIWVSNPNILGYNENLIEKESFEILIPSPIRENHYRLVAHARSLWRPHNIFSVTHNLYMVHKNQYLIPIFLKERITNSRENKLLMMSSIKINREGFEVALLYEETNKLASWVRDILDFRNGLLSFKSFRMQTGRGKRDRSAQIVQFIRMGRRSSVWRSRSCK